MIRVEQWMPCIGFEGRYEVSDLGRVRSLTWEVRTQVNVYLKRGRVLKQHQRKNGYRSVTLHHPERGQVVIPVHALVAEAFLGPRPPGQQVRHGAAGPSDSSLGNLSYGTPAENAEDKKRDGTYQFGETNASAKLTETQVRDIAYRYRKGETQASLAREFGVVPSAISHALAGRNWPHLTDTL